MAVDTEATVATDTARGLLMLKPSPAMAGATAMVVMAVATMARGLLMPSLRLRPRLSPDTVMAVDTDTVATAAAMVVMAAMAVATTARGLLMPSLRLMPLLRLSLAMAVTDMVVTVVVMVATAMARGLLSPAMAMVATAGATVAMAATAMAGATATGVSYHRIRRSELSQKQNYKNSQRRSCENMKKKEIHLHRPL